MAHGHTRMFIKQLILKPGSTGAVLPSSDGLAQRIVEFAAPGPNAVVCEFGPGTGVFTRRILESLQPNQHFFAIELNQDFARALWDRFPHLHLHVGDAAGVADYCRDEGVDRVDCVISGLPWANFPEEVQDHILDSMLEVMPAGAIFVTFAYLQGLVMPGGIRFKQKIKRLFSNVENSGIIWKNVPPAIIYRCRK